MGEEGVVSVTVRQESDYVFKVTFDDTIVPDLSTDSTSPGSENGPDPTRLLIASVANCVGASLLFALRKFKNEHDAITVKAAGETKRNAQGRLRLGRIALDVRLAENAAAYQHLERILTQFEQFCMVSESVRTGITIDIEVHDGEGQRLHHSSSGPQ